MVRMKGTDFLELMPAATHAAIATESPNWIAARRARERLQGSLLDVGDAIAAPMASGVRWRRRLRRELTGLLGALEDHIAESESHDGLLQQIDEYAPRLSRSVQGLRNDHVELAASTRDLVAQIEGSASSLSLRRGVLKLLGRFALHRHHGADLVYEAYGVDIGGG